MPTEIPFYCLALAFFLDLLVGDPRSMPHPVVFMGRAIAFFEAPFRKLIANPFQAGLAFALFLICSTWLISQGLVILAVIIHPILGNIVQAILLFFCFSARTLQRAARDVDQALEFHGLAGGREKVAMIVGRETASLSETGVVKATVETVAENFVDGFLAPLVFALIGGAPLALMYKMINTLDSMVGYQNEIYILFGRAAARIDDAANFIPARLSLFVISLAAALLDLMQGMRALKIGLKEGRHHKSPNAGYPEAAFAGALKIRLGGPNVYHGTLMEKPHLGNGFPDPTREKIKAASDLLMLSSLVSFLLVLFSRVLFY